MGNRTLKAPGVEIIEHDLSGYTTTNLGTGCLITGFAQKGEDLEPIKITNRTAWELNFGKPTNEAEEYFYNAGMEVLNQGGFLHAAKIPYSNDIAGIYAASKFVMTTNRPLAKLDEEAGMFMKDELDENGEVQYWGGDENDGADAPEVGNAAGRLCQNYRSLKDLGLNRLSLIAPAGQDFLSKDLVDEYETGESVPGDNVIYLVDKTRSIYTRAPEIADKQDNRDPRACIGIVPVITTLCNTAYFQGSSTGVQSDVPELYQPVRSLKTIQFPAGAAAAAEYKATKFVDSDLHTPLMKDSNTFATSLSERAATIAQSCLVNANLVDGKFKPYICNDICVVVFRAFVSTEDGKIDFEVAESWVGSLDPKGRDEKGRTTFIDTIINNNSEYIYCFSHLMNPEQILNPDHGFVAGSDSEYDEIKAGLTDDREYLASSLFSAYAAMMLGFTPADTPESSDSEFGLAAPRDFTYEVDESESSKFADLAYSTMSCLRKFYNQDAKQRICTVDQLSLGKVYTGNEVKDLITNAIEEISDTTYSFNKTVNGNFTVSEKFIVDEPTVEYLIDRKVDKDGNYDPVADTNGKIEFTLSANPTDPKGEKKFLLDDYTAKLEMGNENDLRIFDDPDVSTEKLGELSILNSTDYLRAITQFEELVNLTDKIDDSEDENERERDIAGLRQQYVQALIKNSIEKSTRYKAKLRYCKKAWINLDKLNTALVESKSEDASTRKRGEDYINQLYTSYMDSGVLGGITWSEAKDTKQDKPTDTISGSKDALEAKLDEIINTDMSKKEKMNPKKTLTARGGDKEWENSIEFKYFKMLVYLRSQYFTKLAEMYKTVAKIMEDCCYAQSRYIESKRNTDDSSIMLGFYPEMAEPIITYTTIAQSLNKIFDEMGDVHTSEIDVVCDAGISNIAQFVKQVYDPSADDGEDVGGLYEPVKSQAYYKFNKNTDLAYWKTIVFKFDTFCKFRGDCMFCTEAPRHMVLTGNKPVVRKTKKDTSIDLNILPYLSKIAGINTSYGAGYLNWYRTISDFTGDTLWVPPSIKAMGTYILTDKQYNWWDAPAGMRRGVINLVETSFNPNKIQAGEIYDTNWNYAIHYLNDGIIQEGQKTFQTRQSALDRVNVRRLLGRIKRYVYFASRQFLYEPHTQAIREKYVKTIKPFFEDLVNRGGLYDFKIICDSTNNTPEVIDRNELRVKIGIKPVKTIEFIIIDLCTLNTGAEWTEMDSI